MDELVCSIKRDMFITVLFFWGGGLLLEIRHITGIPNNEHLGQETT